MGHGLMTLARCAAVAAALMGCMIAGTTRAEGDAKRGQYLVDAGGCLGCHTASEKSAQPFAGGRALKTPFGTFYGPNITPDPVAGIGKWTESMFVQAMRHGQRPDGENYFPAFPYPSFTRISDSDLGDIWAYLRSLPPSSKASRPHELKFPFGFRLLVTPWKWLFFTAGPMQPDNSVAGRGAYLALALGHCGECHTPRNVLGGPRRDRLLAGGAGPEGKNVPNLTPAKLKKWSDGELQDFLQTGLYSDGDVASEAMNEVIRNTTSKLTKADLSALIGYLRNLPAVEDEPK